MGGWRHNTFVLCGQRQLERRASAQGECLPLGERQRLERRESPSGGSPETNHSPAHLWSGSFLFPNRVSSHPTSGRFRSVLLTKQYNDYFSKL